MRARTIAAALFCALIAALTTGGATAVAQRATLTRASLEKNEEQWLLTDGIEGACGVAVSPFDGNLYVSDYYHRTIDIFNSLGEGAGTLELAGGDPRADINELNAVCGLAFDSSGNLYANELHQRRVLLLPGEQVIDSNESTGVAVDGDDNVYVDNRTYVAKYEAPVVPGEQPVEKIGLGSLGDGYGVAVDAKGERVYVPDAADNEVKVYKPAISLAEPVATIDGPGGSKFVSLADAAVAVDTSPGEGSGHLLVIDDLKPGAEDPEAAIYEFDADGKILSRLKPRTYGAFGGKQGPIFGEPSGLAFDAQGNLYVTTGNDKESNLLKYGPYEPFSLASGTESLAPPSEESSAVLGAAARPPIPPSAASARGASASVVVQRRGVRVSFDGKLTPHVLPRHGMAPVGIAVDARIAATGGEDPPQLRRIAIAINRNGHFTSQGLPLCSLREIQPSTTSGALAACGGSLVGEGHFSADVKLPEQSPFPSDGKVLAFNGRVHGKPAILAHIYGSQPAPTSAVLPFVIKGSRGTYGTILEASLPRATGNWGFVTGLQMSLRRNFHYRGKSRSFLSAGCPAPAGFPSAAFPLARTRFAFASGLTLVSVLSRTCRARG